MSGVSGNLLDEQARQLIAGMSDLLTVVDIGPGRGKYGQMVRNLVPGAHLTAVEIDADYVTEFGLAALYDTVLTGPGSLLMDRPDDTWDLVICGDVLEHMRKHDGVDLLHFLVYRARVLWLQWPLRYMQGSLAGHVSEAHVSVWTEADVKALNADYVKFEVAPLEAYAVNGYPNAGRHVQHILGVFNGQSE